MPARRIRVAPADALREGFEEIRAQAGVVSDFAAGRRSPRRRRRPRAPATAPPTDGRASSSRS